MQTVNIYEMGKPLESVKPALESYLTLLQGCWEATSG